MIKKLYRVIRIDICISNLRKKKERPRLPDDRSLIVRHTQISGGFGKLHHGQRQLYGIIFIITQPIARWNNQFVYTVLPFYYKLFNRDIFCGNHKVR